MAEDSGEKTEEPTDKRKKDLRKKGMIARTPELTVWGGLLIAAMLGPWLVQSINTTYRNLLKNAAEIARNPDEQNAVHTIGEALKTIITTPAVFFAGMAVFAIVANVAQTRGQTTFSLLKPKAERISPFKGLKRIFSKQGAWAALKSLLKIIVLVAAAWGPVSNAVTNFLAHGPVAVTSYGSVLGRELTNVIRNVALAGLLLAAADFVVAKRRLRKQSLMTRYEVKREYEEAEGNPEVRSRRRSMQRRMAAEARQLNEVRTASVVVVNPTHYAVALTYDPQWGPPKIVARGIDGLALRIRETAENFKVPVVEDPPLARFLHASCKLNAAVSEDLFQVVAVLLHFVSEKRVSAAAGQALKPRRELLDIAGVPQKLRDEAEAKLNRAFERSDPDDLDAEGWDGDWDEDPQRTPLGAEA